MSTEDLLTRQWQLTDKRSLICLAILNLLLMITLQFLNAALVTGAAPGGIVSYEFVANLDEARTILNAWSPRQQLYAAFSLGLDYLFMPAYALLLAGLCRVIARRQNAPFLTSLGNHLAVGQFVAAGFDVLENVALIQLLLGSEQSFWPPLSYGSASIKFTLVTLGILYIVAGFLRNRFYKAKS